MATRFQGTLALLIGITVLHNVHAEAAKGECERTLTIGVSLPLTAGAVSSGEAVKNGIILADERYDANNCVRFVFEDDQFMPKTTRTVVNKLIDHEGIDGLIVYGTPTSIAVADLVERKKVPTIALSILTRLVQGRTYIMKHWCSAERLNEAVVREVRRRGYKRVAIVSTQNDAMLGLRDLFVDEKVSTVVLDDEFVAGSDDFRSSIAKIGASNADAVYVLLYPPQVGTFMKQLRKLGFKGDAFGVHNLEDPHEVQSSAGAMVGMWLANGDDNAGESYREKYRGRFGIEAALGGASGYDTAKIFIEAAQKVGDINSYLHGVRDFQGAFGRYNATAANDFDFGAVIKVVEHDGFRKVSE